MRFVKQFRSKFLLPMNTSFLTQKRNIKHFGKQPRPRDQGIVSMQLTRLLCYYQHRMKVPGLLYEGKNRLVKPLNVEMKKRALNQLFLEKRNQDLLSRPYMTKEVSAGHTKNSGIKQKRYEEIVAKRKHKMLPNCSYETEIRRSLELRKGWGSLK